MTIITLPPDVEESLLNEARRRGTSPEALAIESLRHQFGMTSSKPNQATSLFDILSGHVGTVAGSSEAWSEDCGKRFAAALTDDHNLGTE